VRGRLGLALAVSILALGAFGAWSYVRNYALYRGFPPPRDPAGVASGRLIEDTFHSGALHRKDSYLVYLPPGYGQMASQGTRFSALYLLHGSSSGGQTFIDAGKVGVDLDTLLAEQRVRPFILVMPNAQDPSSGYDTDWANTAHGAYESEVLAVVRPVDRHFATIRDRSARAIAGDSMGGYGAVNVALHHLDVFGSFESWSGYFTQTPTDAFSGAERAALARNSPAHYLSLRPARFRRLPTPTNALLYSGAADPLNRQQAPFARELRRLGVRVLAVTLPGSHSWKLWRGKMKLALRFAGQALSPPS
jgi:enterochelin esterase-like enzyme